MGIVFGKDINLPLVTQVGAIRSHSAHRITWHSHQCYELICVLDGAASYQLDDGQTLELAGGHFAVVPPEIVHRGAHNARTPVTLCGIQLDPSRANALRNAPITNAELAVIRTELQRAGFKVRAFSPAMRQNIEQLLTEIEFRRQACNRTLVWAIMRTLACKIILEAVRSLSTPHTSRPRIYVEAASHFLTQRLEREFSLADRIRHLGISRTRLFTLFKAETGMTPNDFLLRCRIERTGHLLVATAKPVTTIALDVGFNSSQYISRVFRRCTGETPRHSVKRIGRGQTVPCLFHNPIDPVAPAKFRRRADGWRDRTTEPPSL